MSSTSLFHEMTISVARRGFHDQDAYVPLADHPVTVMQSWRLLEEAGEVGRALRQGNAEQAIIELADLVITAQNLAHRIQPGITLDRIIADKLARDEHRGYLHGEEIEEIQENHQ